MYLLLNFLRTHNSFESLLVAARFFSFLSFIMFDVISHRLAVKTMFLASSVSPKLAKIFYALGLQGKKTKIGYTVNHNIICFGTFDDVFTF